MVRLDVSSNDPDLLAAAFRADGGAKTFIFLNRSTQPKEVSLPDSAHDSIDTVEHASLYRENSIDPAPRNLALVEPGEIVTITTTPLIH